MRRDDGVKSRGLATISSHEVHDNRLQRSYAVMDTKTISTQHDNRPQRLYSVRTRHNKKGILRPWRNCSAVLGGVVSFGYVFKYICRLWQYVAVVGILLFSCIKSHNTDHRTQTHTKTRTRHTIADPEILLAGERLIPSLVQCSCIDIDFSEDGRTSLACDMMGWQLIPHRFFLLRVRSVGLGCMFVDSIAK